MFLKDTFLKVQLTLHNLICKNKAEYFSCVSEEKNIYTYADSF